MVYKHEDKQYPMGRAIPEAEKPLRGLLYGRMVQAEEHREKAPLGKGSWREATEGIEKVAIIFASRHSA